MVFIRTHLIKGRLSAAQKEELGAKLGHAVANVEGLVDNAESEENTWVQFYEFDPENWYAPATLPGSRPESRIQIDVIAPQKLVDTPELARAILVKVNDAVRSVLGPGLLPAHGPWVHVYTLPLDNFGIDGHIPDWEGWRAQARADTPEQAEEALGIVYGPGRHTSTGLFADGAALPTHPGPWGKDCLDLAIARLQRHYVRRLEEVGLAMTLTGRAEARLPPAEERKEDGHGCYRGRGRQREAWSRIARLRVWDYGVDLPSRSRAANARALPLRGSDARP